MNNERVLSIEDMMDAIRKKINEDDHVSFVEVERIFEDYGFDYKGGMTICHPKSLNLLIWDGWNQSALDLLNQLISNEPFAMHSTHTITYLIDGGALNLPLAKSVRDYKHPHWLPMVLRPTM